MKTTEVKMDPQSGRMIMSDEIFNKYLGDGNHRPLTLGDLPNDLLLTDKIYINYDDGHFSENNSWDPFTEVSVYRERLETDEERKNRIIKSASDTDEITQRRYKLFLQLKQEFEPTL